MAIKYRTFSNDLKAKDLCYPDQFFTLKGQKIIPSDSFSFGSYQALKDVNDFKTNNLSNLFLINKQQTSNWLNAKVRQGDKLNGLATTISWFTNSLDNQGQLGSWLYFAKNYEMFDINVSTVECLLTYGKTTKHQSNYIFYLEFLDDNTCRISHTFGDLVFYLCVEDDKTLHFSKNIDGEKEVFIYNIDGGLMKLYKRVNHKKYDVRDIVIGSYNKLYLLQVNRVNNQASLVLSEDINDESQNSLIYINESEMMFDYYMDNSWVGYDRNKRISAIDRDRSAFQLKSQALLHHEYNKEDGFNFIPLKNNYTYKGNSIRGNNTNISNSNYPDVDYRTYTSINSGYNQQFGNDNIILTYTFVDQEYELNEGQDLIFTIPEKSLQGTNLMQPLWPFKYINLNDTKFIKNGAFGSNVPYFSDKFKKLQSHKSTIKDSEGNRLTPNNETYLCSWLYKPTHESEPIWLDRYYYPDLISRADALKSEEHYSPSFQNIIDMNYSKDEQMRKKMHKLTHFDKKSDLTIEAGNTYRYQRISNGAIVEVLENLKDNEILKCTNQSKKEVNLSDGIYFNNETYRKIDYKDWKKTNSINFNGDFYLRRNKRMGLQIFGTDYTNGFNIQNRKDLAPYQYYASDKVIYLLNNKLQIVHQFDLYSKYEDYILKVFLGDIFDDVVVLSGTWMYIFSYDLMLRSRIDLTATADEDNGIKDLQSVTKNEIEGTSLLNYPYGNNGVSLKQKPSTNEIELNIKTNTFSVDLERNRIAIYNVQINQNVKTSGDVKIPSNMCELMCKQTPILYKNNIYVPMYQNIMKIIMCPDCQADFKVFGDGDRENYPACARVLHSSEYYLNYNKTSNAHGQTQSLGVEGGFIEVENVIKKIHIDEDGTIYGLNFDEYGVSCDGDTIYGLYSWERYINSGGWWWLFNQSLSKMKSDVSTAKYAEWASPNSIDRVKLNENGEMCLIRNFNNLADNINPDNNKRFEVYDKTKQLIYQYDLTAYDKVYTLDAYNYINEAHEEQTCFCMLVGAYGYIYKIIYKSNEKDIEINRVDLPSNICPNFTETVNSNALLRYKGYNVLYFNLHVPSHYTYPYIATIKWDLEDIQDGWYNINVEVDLEKAEFIVRINDEIHEVVNEETHSWFKPYESANGTTFTTSYYLGILGKKYGTTMNKLLKNSPYDPYTCKNLMIEKLSIHNRRLSYYEYLAMRMRYSKVNKLILTLPCGSRSNIDEIIRYFKYNSSPSISNKIKINVSGTGLQTSGEFDMLKKEILAVLENNTDCLMTVKDIQFIENE